MPNNDDNIALVKIEALTEDMKELKADVREISRQGDMKDLIKKVEELEKKVDSLTTWKTWLLGAAAVISFLFFLGLQLGT